MIDESPEQESHTWHVRQVFPGTRIPSQRSRSRFRRFWAIPYRFPAALRPPRGREEWQRPLCGEAKALPFYTWHVRQVFLDEEDDGDFRIEADVDLDATQEQPTRPRATSRWCAP